MMFSIVTLTYKRIELLEESVYSVLQQTYKNWELIIINDCESQTIHFNHPQIRIFNLKNRFKTIADKRNFGLKNTFGDWIFNLDDDDFLLPTYLENLKELVGEFEWVCSQKPILYSNDINKIYLSPVPQTNTFVFTKKVAEQFQYEVDGENELDPFYKKVKKDVKGLRLSKFLPPDKCGYVWRIDNDSRRKYSLVSFIEKNIPQDKWNEQLNDIGDKCGDIMLSPKWENDYVSIIKNNIKYVDPLYAFNRIKNQKTIFDISKEVIKEYKSKGTFSINYTGSVQQNKIEVPVDSWTKVKPTWANAIKFIESAKSRGILSTTLNVIGVSNEFGNRVSDEILKQRQLSCFGDSSIGIPPCNRLQKNNKGVFCGSCGCGDTNIARLDSDSEDGYTKLHYPQLECPLRKPGFSNEDKSNKIPLSIIISVLNDNEELNLTIKSIRETSPSNVEIIVVDDCSDIPVKVEDSTVKLIRRDERVGAGNSKHIGVEMAHSKYVLIIDSHMRFVNGWYDEAMKVLPGSEKTLWCAVCLGLNENNMDCNKANGAYYGADLVFYEPEKGRVFQGVWTKQKSGENYEISCVMGACYFAHKDYFLYVGGTKSHKMWGSLEPLISLKYWLSGGEVRLMSKVKIGHKFRQKSPYSTDLKYIEYNKIRPLKTFLPDELYQCLINKIPNNKNKENALHIINSELEEIEKEKEFYKKIFKYDVYWLMSKFNIRNPCYNGFKNSLTFKDYAIHPDEYDFLIELVKTNDIKTILEFGSGVSTYAFIEAECFVTSAETSKNFINTEFPNLKSFNNCELIFYDPLDMDKLIINKTFDLSFVDGPRGTPNLSRLQQCLYSMKKTNHILLHDFRRQGEKETFNFITKKFPEWKFQVFETKRYIGYLYNSNKVLPLKTLVK